MTTFKKILSEQRRNNKLTLRKLSELTGISASYLSEIENGVKLPPKKETSIKRIAKALNYDSARLIDLSQNERAKGRLPSVLEKLFSQDEELAWGLCREAETDENNIQEFREFIKEALKSWEEKKK